MPIEAYGPERDRELNAATEPVTAESGRYVRTDTDDIFEADVGEERVEIVDAYGAPHRSESVGAFVMRIEMGVYQRIGDGRHV